MPFQGTSSGFGTLIKELKQTDVPMNGIRNYVPLPILS
jgi:hypothetical protein